MRVDRLLKAGVSLVLVLLVLALLVVDGKKPVQARENPYSTLQHDIVVSLDKTGLATITETIRYKLHDDLRDLVFTLPLRSGQTASIERIAVADTITKIDQALFVETVLAESSNKQANPMTYHLQQKDQQLEIALHLFLTAGSERTINLTYTIEPVAYRHSDIAAWRQRFFMRPPGDCVVKASLRLIFPQSVQSEQAWILPSSLTPFSQSRQDDGSLVFATEQLAAGHTLLLTCLLPADSMTGVPEAAEPLTAENLMAQALQEDAALQQEAELRGKAYSAIFFLIGLAALLFLAVYWFYDREGAYPDKQRYLRDVLHACSPVALALLVRRKRPAQLILTTLLSLVDKGLLRCDGSIFTRVAEEPADQSHLSSSERYLLQWFFTDLAIDHVLSVAQIRRYARHEETADAFRRQFSAWRLTIENELAEHGFIDRGKTFRGRLVACITALVYALLSVMLTIFLQTGVALLLLVPAIGFLLYSGVLRRLTNKGRERYAEGQALARYLRRISQLPPFPDAATQSRLIPYAMALGLIQQYLRTLPMIWESQPVKDQLDVYGVSRQKHQPLKDQISQLAADLRFMESMLASSLLISERIHH